MDDTTVETSVRTFSHVIAANVHEHVIVVTTERVEEQISNMTASSVVRAARTATRALIYGNEYYDTAEIIKLTYLFDLTRCGTSNAVPARLSYSNMVSLN